MLVMTAKFNMKKVLTLLIAVAALIIALVLLFGNPEAPAQATAAPSLSTNDGRLAFLAGFGWQVTSAPTESTQVKIPAQETEVFARYNALQKSQGYDLSQYAGKTAMRYVYEIKNYPGATEPVYATVLVYKNQVIGGDVTNCAATGQVHGFALPEGTLPSQPAATTPPTIPTDPTAPAQTAATQSPADNAA